MVCRAPASDILAAKVHNLHKAYRRGSVVAPVLRGVDLQIERGQCVFLAGPSGSGKTTLLSILGCILSPDQGEVSICGQNLAALDDRASIELRRYRIGFVFQRFHLIRGLSVCQNVAVPLVLRGEPARQAHRRAMEMLEAVGLAPHAHAHPHNLSAGQCQRVAVARALVGDPDLILADEPTASLDAASGQEVMDLLGRLVRQRGKTAIVVTHDQRIFHFADRVFWLENGRVADHLQTSPRPPASPKEESP